MKNGLIYGTIACALWGLSLLLPLVAASFSPMEIAIGRYLCYGLFSLFCFVRLRGSWPLRIWCIAIAYALFGNVVYYALEVVGIRLIGADTVALLFCLLPVLLAATGNLVRREYPFVLLAWPLVLIAIGMMLSHWNSAAPDHSASTGQFVLGVTVTLTAIFMWVLYAIHNTNFLQANSTIHAGELSTLVGVCCFFCSIFLALGCAWFAPDQLTMLTQTKSSTQYLTLALSSIILGVAVSWLGTDMWNRASRLLPVSVVGQLVVLEVIAGLIYVFAWELRLPSVLESAGILCALGGVTLGLARVHNYRPAQYA